MPGRCRFDRPVRRRRSPRSPRRADACLQRPRPTRPAPGLAAIDRAFRSQSNRPNGPRGSLRRRGDGRDPDRRLRPARAGSHALRATPVPASRRGRRDAAAPAATNHLRRRFHRETPSNPTPATPRHRLPTADHRDRGKACRPAPSPQTPLPHRPATRRLAPALRVLRAIR